VRHQRHYTVDQADASRPLVADRITRGQAAARRLAAPGARAALAAASADEGGGYPNRPVASDVVNLHAIMGELAQMDVVVRDLARGLVDFPAIREGAEVYLCWTLDEPRVAHWHTLDAGAAGRRPL
jgi:hypothetical protein